MADTPEGAVSLSDDDLDEIVSGLDGNDTESSTDTVEDSEGTADNSDEAQQDESDTTGETEEGEEETTDLAAETPPPEGAAAPAAGSDKAERPFTFKGSGQVHTFPNAVEMPDGTVWIAKEGAEQLRQTLASYVGIQSDWKNQRRDLERKLRTASEGRNELDIEAEAITELFKDVRQMTAEERWQWANDFDQRAPSLEIQIEKQKLAREREMLSRERSGGDLLPEERQERAAETLNGELKSTFQRLMSLPEARSLNRDEQIALWNKWANKTHKLVSQADRDMPEYGIRRGDPYFDDQDVVDDFIDRIQVRSQATKSLSAADRNNAMNADQRRPNAIPPVARGRLPSTDGKGKPKKLKGKAFEKAFMSGKLDDMD